MAKFYDIAADELREPTQEDLDRFGDAVSAYGFLRTSLMVINEISLEIAQGKRSAFDLKEVIKKMRVT